VGLGVWEATIRRALEVLEDEDLSKVVLARVLTASSVEGRAPVDVAMALWQGNPASHVFYFEPTTGHCLVGAAPETVTTVAGGEFRATAVAGTISKGASAEEQQALARRLIRSRKERLEHQVSVDDMVDRLGTMASRVHAEDEPHVLTLSSIQHLETIVEATLRPGETALSVLERLHPTPAVCGHPRDKALEFIQAEEPFDRGWYAGPVGWFDGDGNGVFVPALRSAAWRDPEWRLFAGAGIVRGSDPAQEWEETRIKFQPVLRALSEARSGGLGAPEGRTAGKTEGMGR
jgi:isochorismate synthase